MSLTKTALPQPKRVALLSIFRNASSYVERFAEQVDQLERLLSQHGTLLEVYVAEGDSTDNTYQLLFNMFGNGYYNAEGGFTPCKLIQVNHGGPVFGSVDDAVRWRQISKVCNTLLGVVPDCIDGAVYVESDLIWQPETILRLLEHVWVDRVDAVAPMCFHQETGKFYDIWGHRIADQYFTPDPPYHPDLAGDMVNLAKISSAGSCIAMKGEVARTCRYTPPELGMVGFGHDIQAHGYSLWLDPTQAVFHP